MNLIKHGIDHYRNYKDWIEANNMAVDEQRKKDHKPRLEYVSETTKHLIDERGSK